MLRELLRRHPSLAREADTIAHAMLSEEADGEAIASEVEDAVLWPQLDELNDRAGRKSWGYVDPADAAWELMHEAVEPFLDELRRGIKLGMQGSAVATCQGIVLGLYRCRGSHPDHVVDWAPDFVEEMAMQAVSLLAQAKSEQTRGPWKLPDSFNDEVPEWASQIARAAKPRPDR